MNSETTEQGPFAALFNIPTTRMQLQRAEQNGKTAQPEITPEIREASYITVVTGVEDPDDPDGRILALRVTCPYCGHTHIHSGGTTSKPRTGTRAARCVGRPARGLFYKLTGGEA
ncbi:hypothetical protein ACIQVK_03680 [Streptomyces sp. NPDC090493]|uniref:hypothetical protein n=1 Tax=Streptomyces sp. NPDC090493 TaxID=3365964 RepID=UPI003802C610